MNQDLEESIRDLIKLSAERSAADGETAHLEQLADTTGDEATEAWAVVMLRLRAASYAIEVQSQFLRQLVDEGDLAAAMDCTRFLSALVAGFDAAAAQIVAAYLPERFI